MSEEFRHGLTRAAFGAAIFWIAYLAWLESRGRTRERAGPQTDVSFALTRPWPKQAATIWHFGAPVPLAKPLRTGAGMYNRRVRCDLDLLLTCETVQEVEEQMGKRRQQQPDE